MSLLRVAIGTVGILALTAAFADQPPKAAKSTDQSACRSLPRVGSHIKDHVCGAQLDRYERAHAEVLWLSAPAGAMALPAPGGSTTTPMQ
jgi:hypothetical protein